MGFTHTPSETGGFYFIFISNKKSNLSYYNLRNPTITGFCIKMSQIFFFFSSHCFSGTQQKTLWVTPKNTQVKGDEIFAPRFQTSPQTWV